MTEPDLDAEYRQDHANAAKFALHIALANYLKLLSVPDEARHQCCGEIDVVLRAYEPS